MAASDDAGVGGNGDGDVDDTWSSGPSEDIKLNHLETRKKHVAVMEARKQDILNAMSEVSEEFVSQTSAILHDLNDFISRKFQRRLPSSPASRV